MAFLRLCGGDPLLSALRDVFSANAVRVPEERIQPLGVIAGRDGRAAFRGALAPLLVGDAPLPLGEADLVAGRMADLSGRRSRRVDVSLGLQILEGFLQGFGIPSAGVTAQFARASEVSFAFQDVRRTYIDGNRLGRLLATRRLDAANPAAAIFFGENPYDLLVIDSIITSSDFSMSIERSADQSFKIDVPVLQNLVANASTGVKVFTTSGYDVVFQGDRPLTFAFSCVRLYLDAEGTILAMPPELAEVFLGGRGVVPDSSRAVLAYSPDRVVLGGEPGLLAWDDE